ncbi:hypothetical protein AB0533_001611 [Vibrio parahaemolyticus]
MNSPILELLPSIHATIIGIIAAVISAYAVWAFQKITETKDKLIKALDEAEQYTKPRGCKLKGKLSTDDGLLDWYGAGKDILYKNKSLFLHLDHSDVYGIKQVRQNEPTEEQILLAGDEMNRLFHQFFNTYPFTRNHNAPNGEKSERSFTIEQLQDISSRISFVCWCWRSNRLSILELFKRYTDILQSQENEQAEQGLHNHLSILPDDEPEHVIEDIKLSFYKFRSKASSYSYVDGAIHFFETAEAYQTNVIPVLTKLLSEYNFLKNHFRVQELCHFFIQLAVIVTITGICLPLILLEWLNGAAYFNWHSFAIGWVGYFILLLTISPYFYLAYLAHKKLKTFFDIK